MRVAQPDRIAALDLIRGIAILGILAINIAGFAGPTVQSLSPGALHPVSPADETAFALGFLLFEGKMRALFTLLFGASLALFVAHAEERGRDGDLLQFRRLCWLMVFGQLHYLLFWWGDILFTYGACAVIVLLMRQMPIGAKLTVALAVFVSTHTLGALEAWPGIVAEDAVRTGTATLEQARAHADYLARIDSNALRELALYRRGFTDILLAKLHDKPLWLVGMAWDNLGETLPLMLVGTAFYESGVLAGAWPRWLVLLLATGGTVLGLGATLLALDWLWPRHFPVVAMGAALHWLLAIPHLLTAMGYMSLLALAAPRIGATTLGRWLRQAGNMALSNYIATSVAMTALFYGWGLGLFDTVSPLWQWAFVIGGWAGMLVFSHFWLAHFRRGPLEWLWRSLTEMKILANR